MIIFKAAAAAIIVSIIALGLKKNNASISTVLIIGGSIFIFFVIVSTVVSIISDVQSIFSFTGADYTYLKVILKCLAVSLIAQFSADICSDASNQALANQIIFAGKLTIVAMSMPILKAVLEIITGLINQ